MMPNANLNLLTNEPLKLFIQKLDARTHYQLARANCTLPMLGIMACTTAPRRLMDGAQSGATVAPTARRITPQFIYLAMVGDDDFNLCR